MNYNKANMTVMISVFIIMVVLGVMILRVSGELIWGTKESINLYNKYFSLTMDKNIQNIKQGFEKTAAFHSLMETHEELMAGGNFPEDTLVDTNADGYVDGTGPRLRIESGSTAIPYWALPGCMRTDMRVPYLVAKDPNILVGELNYCVKSNKDGELQQYIEELADGVYDMHMVVNLIMIKKGEVQITGGPGITIEPVIPTPNIITYDGTYEYIITGIGAGNLAAGNECPLTIQFNGTNSIGEVDEVAVIKQIGITIYDNNIIHAQNELFTENLNKYHANMETLLTEKNSELENDIVTEIKPLQGIYIPGSFAKGIVWSEEDGITLSVKDLFGKPDDNLVTITSSGLIEEEIKVRHYALSDAGEYLLLNLDTLIKNKIFDGLNALDDYHRESETRDCCDECSGSCLDGCCDNCEPLCPNDDTDKYDENDFLNIIQSALNSAETNLNTIYNSDDLVWEFVGPVSIRMDCADGHTNDHTSFGSGTDECTGGDNVETGSDAYLTYHDHIKSDCSVSSCTCGYGDCGTDGNPIKCRKVTCTVTYGHFYALKHIKVLVKITDAKYKYYDVSTNQWVNPTLQFYILIDKVEDNDCDGNSCTGIHTTDSAC